jgi:hypothetical protein
VQESELFKLRFVELMDTQSYRVSCRSSACCVLTAHVWDPHCGCGLNLGHAWGCRCCLQESFMRRSGLHYAPLERGEQASLEEDLRQVRAASGANSSLPACVWG